MLIKEITITGLWILFLLSYLGIGLSFQRLFKIKNQSLEDILSSFWIGWGLTLVLLQIWHLFAPVNEIATMAFIITGTAGIIWNRQVFNDKFKEAKVAKLFFILAMIVFALWMSNQAMDSFRTTGGDAGDYHIPAVKWVSNYPIIRGLGNLYYSFAYNTSYWLYLALMNGVPEEFAYRLGLGLLSFVAVIQIGMCLSKLIIGREKIRPYDYFLILTALPIIRYCYQGASTSYDKPLVILGIVIGAHICKMLFNKDSQDKINYQAFQIIFLSAIGVSIKLSFIAFGLTASLIALSKIFFFKAQTHPKIQNPMTFVFISGMLLLLFMPWMLRGVLLSGYIAFPATLGSFNVKWKMPPDRVESVVKLIKHQARDPKFNYEQVFESWDWFIPWIKKVLRSNNILETLIITLVGVSLAFFYRKIRDPDFASDLLFLSPAIFSIIFWLLSAPDERFSQHIFWYLAAASSTLAIKRWRIERNKILIWAILILTFAIVGRFFVNSIIRDNYRPIPSSQIKPVQMKSNLTVYHPSDYLCWDAPLPCSPEIDPNLRLIDKGDLRSGFMLTTVSEKSP